MKNAIFTAKKSPQNSCITALENTRKRSGRARDAPETRFQAPPTRNDAEDESAQGRRTKTRWRGITRMIIGWHMVNIPINNDQARISRQGLL